MLGCPAHFWKALSVLFAYCYTFKSEEMILTVVFTIQAIAKKPEKNSGLQSVSIYSVYGTVPLFFWLCLHLSYSDNLIWIGNVILTAFVVNISCSDFFWVLLGPRSGGSSLSSLGDTLLSAFEETIFLGVSLCGDTWITWSRVTVPA